MKGLYDRSSKAIFAQIQLAHLDTLPPTRVKRAFGVYHQLTINGNCIYISTFVVTHYY